MFDTKIEVKVALGDLKIVKCNSCNYGNMFPLVSFVGESINRSNHSPSVLTSYWKCDHCGKEVH